MKRAFSLIELLVAITIMAILMGIVLAALPRAREAAVRTACGGNLHGVGQGVEAYKNDHDSKFPTARYMPPPWLSGDEDPPFNVALADYIEPLSGAYRCPGDKVVYDIEYIDAAGEIQTCNMSYTYLIILSGRTFEETIFNRFLNRTPSETPVMYDFDGGSFELQSGELVGVDFFHRERNFLFADSHIGGIKAPAAEDTNPPPPPPPPPTEGE